MSEVEDFMIEGFGEIAREFGTTIKVGTKTKTCVSAPIVLTAEMRDAGIWPDASMVVEMLRSDADELGIADRVECLVDGRKFVVIRPEPDPSDLSTLRIGLKLAHR